MTFEYVHFRAIMNNGTFMKLPTPAFDVSYNVTFKQMVKFYVSLNVMYDKDEIKQIHLKKLLCLKSNFNVMDVNIWSIIVYFEIKSN